MGELDLRDIALLKELEESMKEKQEKLDVIKSYLNYQKMPLTVEYSDTYYGVVFDHVDGFLYELYAFTDTVYDYICEYGFDKVEWEVFLEEVGAYPLCEWKEYDPVIYNMFCVM